MLFVNSCGCVVVAEYAEIDDGSYSVVVLSVVVMVVVSFFVIFCRVF